MHSYTSVLKFGIQRFYNIILGIVIDMNIPISLKNDPVIQYHSIRKDGRAYKFANVR